MNVVYIYRVRVCVCLCVFFSTLFTIFEQKDRGSREPFIVSVQLIPCIFVFAASTTVFSLSQNAYCHVLARCAKCAMLARVRTQNHTHKHILL